MFEVEKRSLLKSEKEFEIVKAYLDTKAEPLGITELKSYLFRAPTFLRIRLTKGSNMALITDKTDKYTNPARKEDEKEIPIEELPAFVQRISVKGYHKCSEIKTNRASYKLNGVKVELNRIDHLGLIVEVEALTEDKSQIPRLEEMITQTFKQLQITELNAEKYQAMMDAMYAKTLKATSKHSFEF